MTPKEIVEKIIHWSIEPGKYEARLSEMSEFLAVQIAEAEREAEERTIKLGGIVAEEVYEKGYNAAREQAAKIAERGEVGLEKLSVYDALGEQIRAMHPEGSK